MTLNEKNAKMRRKLIKSKELYEYNKAIVYGTITKEFEPCYEVDGHKFYRSEISSKKKKYSKRYIPNNCIQYSNQTRYKELAGKTS